MNYTNIVSAKSFIEPTSFGKIVHLYSDQLDSLPKENVFKSFLGLKEFFFKPGLGLLPHAHEDITAILVPIKGALAQKSKKNLDTIIFEGELQLLESTKEDLHIKYNLNKRKNLDCLVYYLSSKNKINCSKTFTLKNNINTITKVFESKLHNKEEETIHFYIGNYESNIKETTLLKKICKGVIIYMVSGEITLTKENKILKKKDTYAFWSNEALSFITNKNSKFFILEIHP